MSKRKDSGTSTFRRADGRWVFAYQIEPGRWKQHMLSAHDERSAKREGHRWHAEQIAAGALGGPKTKTIAELWRDWIKLRAASPKLATSTVRDNESHFARDIVPVLGAIEIAQLTPFHVRDFVRTFQTGRSASKVRNVVSSLSAFYEDCRAEGWVASASNVVRDPAVNKVLPDQKANADPVYIPRELAQSVAIAETTPEHRRVVYVVAFLSGMRDGEMHGLKWSDVHLDSEIPYVRVERAFAMKASATKYADLTDTKTEGSVRSIPLHPAARASLRWWSELGWPFFVGRDPKPDDAVFASVNGAHWRPKSAREIRTDLAAAGLATANEKGETYDFHGTRRSFSTWLADEGVDDATVGMLLGHVGKSTATRHYTAAVLRRLAEAVDRIPFRWQDPPRSNVGSPHSADLVRTHSETSGGNAQVPETFNEAPVAQWTEQRFPNSSPAASLPAFLHVAHNGADVHGADANGASAEVARYESRAAAFDGQRQARRKVRESRRREREDEAARLLLDAKAVVMGDTDIPEAHRPDHVRSLLRRADELLRTNLDKGAA